MEFFGEDSVQRITGIDVVYPNRMEVGEIWHSIFGIGVDTDSVEVKGLQAWIHKDHQTRSQSNNLKEKEYVPAEILRVTRSKVGA